MNGPHRASPTHVHGADSLGDDTALFTRFWQRLRVFALRRLGDSAAAEDVAQETLERVLSARREGRLRDEEALPAFVFATARHVCLHHVRSAGREERALRRLTPAGERVESLDILASIVSEERRSAVRRALPRLGDDDRELLRLLYFDGLDAAAAAERLGCTAGALRVRKHRALQRLAELLQGSP